MDVQDLIVVIENHSRKAGLFSGRFVKISDCVYRWNLPSVDLSEPIITLTENVIKHSHLVYSDEKITWLTYDELITRYPLK